MKPFIRFTNIVLCCISIMLNSQNILAAENTTPKKDQLVSVEKAKQKLMMPSVWLTGNVISRLDIQISTEQSGRLEWILDIGETVKKNAPVAKLDSRLLELQIKEKNALFRQQQANTAYLKKQQKRLASLLHKNSTARIELDRTERDLEVAKEQLTALKIQIQQIELALEKTVLRAPFDGQINRRFAQQGEYVTTGNPLLQLIDPVALDVSVSAPLSLAAYLSHDSNILIKWKNNLEKIPVRTWSPAGDQSSRTFNVRLNAVNLNLLSGQGVTVSLPSQKAIHTTIIPRDALILRDKETYTVTIDKQSIAHKIKVSVGQGLKDWISINGAIQAGDLVVTRGGERLKDGQKVRIDDIKIMNNTKNIASK